MGAPATPRGLEWGPLPRCIAGTGTSLMAGAVSCDRKLGVGSGARGVRAQRPVPLCLASCANTTPMLQPQEL